MSRTILIFVAAFAPVALASAACSRGEPAGSGGGVMEPQGPNSPYAHPTDRNGSENGSTSNEADNTRNNQEDKSGAIVTPLNQGNGRADLDTTQRIRKALMADDTLSSDAKNIKVITVDGVVTLRGPVKDEHERRVVERKASELAGTDRIDSDLDVESK